MAYDVVRQRVVLFGGNAGSERDDVWEWDGASWSAKPANGQLAPVGGSQLSFVFDPYRRRSILFRSDSVPGVWEWDGVSWTFNITETNPNTTLFSAVAYDPARAQLVLFGGSDMSNQPLDEMWALHYADPNKQYEDCSTDTDEDGDGLVMCDDPDCWGTCTPECPPGVCP